MSDARDNLESSAWILYINSRIAVALGQFEIVYILKYENHRLKDVNGPDFCNQTILWQDKIIKVLDLNCFINLKINDSEKLLYEYIVVLPCIKKTGDITFFGLKIINIPIKLRVKDTQQCDYPDNYDWEKLSSSCFYDEKYGIIPILDLGKISNYLVA